MYVSHIGKQFLKYYNRKHETNYSAKEYFINVLFPLFYDGEYYLHSPGNTPFFQLVARKETNDSGKRKEAVEDLIKKVDEYLLNRDEMPNMSFAISYPSADIFGTTSAQISSLPLLFNEDDIYASWIGVVLNIGIAGGINVLIHDEKIFEYLEEGFRIYRDYVNETPEIRNKIETWNGIWLGHRVSNNFRVNNPLANFHPITEKKDKQVMDRITWVQLYFIFSKLSDDEFAKTYISSLGQMNKTIGFIQFKLYEIKRLSDIYENLFSNIEVLSNRELSQIYETELGFYQACQAGVIGLRQMEPKNFKKFMLPNRNTGRYPKPKNDEKFIINFYIYKLWVIAMLNNKHLLELAKNSAMEFKNFVAAEKRASTKRENLIKDILEAKSRKDFIAKINKLLEEYRGEITGNNEGTHQIAALLPKLVEAVLNDIAADNLPLFVALLKFEYLINN